MVNEGRIIFVSSDMHNPPNIFSKSMPRFISVRELAYPKTEGKGQNSTSMLRYSMAKLCNILCAYEMSERLALETNKHITVNAFNPGLMTDTNFMSMTTNKIVRVVVSGLMTVFAIVIGRMGSSVKSGKSLAALVTEDIYRGTTGKYYDRGIEIKSSEATYDKLAARKLWIESAELLHLKQEETILSLS